MLFRLITYAVFILSAVVTAQVAPCADRKPTDNEVKAAYIYNFAKFVEWPPAKSKDGGPALNVCVAGDALGTALEAIEGKGVGGRTIRIKREPSHKSVRGCDILFIAGSESDHVEQILETLQGASVLTIGDTKGFSQHGVMINFYMEEKKVRFEINPKAANRAGLRISSNLLKIARIVGAP